MPPTIATTIRLPSSIHQQVEQRAAAEQKTLADLLRQLITQGLNNGADHQRLAQLEQRLGNKIDLVLSRLAELDVEDVD